MEELQGFDLFAQPMTLAYAKTRSDATVLREDGEEGLKQHKTKRQAEKERKQAIEAASQEQNAAKRAAADTLAERPAKTSKAAGGVPDEYLPPSKILFLQNMPDDYDRTSIAAVFGRYPGFKEVRMVPGRTGIAFVEYEDEGAAISAKEQATGIELGGKVVKVTYRK